MSWGKTEKYKTFSVTIEKAITKIDKDGNESVVTICYKIKFVDSTKFVTSLLSNRVDNITKGIHKMKYKHCDCFVLFFFFLNMEVSRII